VRQISQNYRTGELTIVDVATPRAPAGGILVQTSRSLISAGTERTVIQLAKKNLLEKARERPDLVKKVIEKARREGPLAAFDAVRTKLDNPIPLGYSLAGIVEEVGVDTHGFARGDRVACAGAGYANHAETNAVPQNLAVLVPQEVTDEEASFVTVGAIALHGVRLVAPTLGSVVVVIGLGLIGQLAVSFLVAHGCDVVGIDSDRSRVERALGRGAVGGGVPGDDCVELVRGLSRGNGADAVVITASSATNEPLVLAGDVARDRAQISVVGLLPIEVPRKTFYEKELSVVVSRSYGPGRYDREYEEGGHDYPIAYVRWTERRNLDAVLRAVARKRIEVASLITHRFTFDDSMQAYALISAERPEPHLGVLLSYETSSNGVATTPATRLRRTETTFAEGSGALGIALVGTGSFATSVLLPSLAKVNEARLVSTLSQRGLSARHAAERYGAGVAASLDDVLSDSRVQAIMIATRHDLHASQAARALSAGRDVFLEKPAGVDVEQLQVLAEAVRASDRLLLVGFNRRFAPFAREIKDAFRSRSTGLVMQGRINAGRLAPGSWVSDPREGGGRVIGEVCHFIDLFSYWADSLPIRVSAHAIGAGAAHSPDDNLVIGLSFRDGSVASLLYSSMGDASLDKESYEIYCGGKVARIEDWRTLAITAKGRTRKSRVLRADKGHVAELEAFVKACRESRVSPIAWESIKATTLATFAIERARIDGRLIEL
jgi:predicted dehydrogenase/threonine dehydrogenase-like Zn-dependent dehydrogenase